MEIASPVDGLAKLAPDGTSLSPSGLASAILVGIVGAMTILITPGFLAVVAALAPLDDAHLGYVVAWDINAMGVTIGISALMLTRCNWRLAVALGIALATVGNLATAAAGSYAAIAAARVLAGCGEGMAVGFAFAALARARNPDRAFALYLVFFLLLGAGLLLVIPSLLERFGPARLFIANGLLAMGALCALKWFPNGRASEGDIFSITEPINHLLAIRALVAVFLYFFATGAMWSYVERIAVSNGLDAATVAQSLSLGTLAGVVGAGVAGLVPASWGRALPLAFSGIVSVASFQLLNGHVSVVAFFLASAMLLFGWNFAQPILSGICAEADRCGRIVCAMGAIQTFGMGLGPAAVGLTLSSGGYAMAIWASEAILLASLAIVIIAIRRPATAS